MVRRALARIGLWGLLSSATIGCTDHSEYHFIGQIGTDNVKFYELNFNHDNFLVVTKEDGTMQKYVDDNKDDLKIESIEITVGENTTKYYTNSSNSAEVEIAEIAQREFDSYLAKITKIQTASLPKE